MDSTNGQVSTQVPINGVDGSGSSSGFRYAISVVFFLFLVGFINACVPRLVGWASELMSQVWESLNHSGHQPSASESSSEDERIAFSVKVQVRDTQAEAENYIRERKIGTENIYEYFNDEGQGLWVDRKIPRRLPTFIFEPRPGYEREFKGLVERNMSGYRLYVFPYESSHRLKDIARECGYGEEAVDWIKIWSTWREGTEEFQTSKCRSGGFCLVLSKECDLSALGRR